MSLRRPRAQSTFQSTLSMRRATFFVRDNNDGFHISIHALHEESDRFFGKIVGSRFVISIHALHEESDFHLKICDILRMHFNPRSP